MIKRQPEKCCLHHCPEIKKHVPTEKPQRLKNLAGCDYVTTLKIT